MEYQKRPGTSGIDGQFYETKLLALLLFRLQHDPTVQDFHLATNINGLGDFDDICIVVKIEGHDRPLAVFLQLKHKQDDKAVINFDNKDKVKYVTSFIKITNRIASRQLRDDFFDPKLNETNCLFIMYTNATFNITNTDSKLENSYAPILNSLLATSDAVGCRAQESDQVVEDFGDCFLENDLELLSKHFVEFLIGKGIDRSMHIMNDEYVQQYHVLLRRKVVDVSGIRKDERKLDLTWRTLTFKRDFFTTEDKYVLILKKHLVKELLKNQPQRLSLDLVKSKLSLDETISRFLNAPSAATLTPLIITHIYCNEIGKLEFLMKRPSSDVDLLQQTNMSRKEIDEAILAAEKSAIEYLLSLELKVPVTFGNVDLAIRGTNKKVNKRLEHLKKAVCDLCKEYQLQGQYKIVEIEDHLGLASAVGNMFTHDETTNMMMFSTNFTSEQELAEQLFLNLKNLIDNIFEYRFVVKTKRFPKLHFDCTDTARGFLNKLIIYETQSNHWKVEEILREKIQERLKTDSGDSVMNCSDTYVSVYLHYHEEILKWWMSPTMGTYLNKKTNLYKQAISNMKAEPQISALQTTFYISRAEYFKISFSKSAMKWMDLLELPSKLFVTTDTVDLTTVKVVHCLKSYFLINKLAVLDVGFVLNMPIADFNSLNAEIKMTEKVLIITWHKTQNYGESDKNKLSTLALATKDKQSIVIMNSELKETIKKLFRVQDVFLHDTEILSNMESQKQILKHAKVEFQGQEVTLDKILDEESVSFVKGGILDTVIRNETIKIGEPLSNVQYDEVKDLYVDRSVSYYDKHDDEAICFITPNDIFYSYLPNNALSNNEYSSDEAVINVKTFLDIPSDVVLLTAPPGMGKSTLVTHLSLNTKDHEDRLWIVRVDFSDYSNQFNEWYKDEVEVNALEALNLLCQVILIDYKRRYNTISFNIIITDGEAHLVNGTDYELADFELSMFLHFYNQRRVIFVFDAFDEICPDYKDKVISFLSVVRDDLRIYKMWVTSRPYSDILSDLETVLGRCFEINHLTFTEQETFLRRFWNKKLLSEKPSEKQIKTLRTFLDNTRETISKAQNWVRFIYRVFVETVRPLVYETTSDAETVRPLVYETTSDAETVRPLVYETTSDAETVRPLVYETTSDAETVRPLVYETTSDAETDDLNTILRIAWRSRQVFPLSGIPLILYFLADYFSNIVNCETNGSKAILEFNLNDIYKMFIENKLITILFQDKNKMDLSKPSTRQLVDKELRASISIHKKLAANIFYQRLINPLDFEELRDTKPLNEQEMYTELNKIKTGTEKIGLISHINSSEEPVFIHRSFEEYFIAEYFCDVIKSDRFKLFQKVLLYCVITEFDTKDTVAWIERKKEADPTLKNTFLEMEKTSPIYTTKYRAYLNKLDIPQPQYIRILASSVNDYEDGCFAQVGVKFEMNYFNEYDDDVKQGIIKYFTHYLICKMRPQLKLHFEGLILFEFRNLDELDVKYFNSVKSMDVNDGILLILKGRGHKQLVPLFMFLTHQDHCGTSQSSNTESMGKNCQRLPTDDIVQTDFVYILLSPDYPGTSSTSDPSFSSEIFNFLRTTSTICNRLHYTEEHVKEIAKKTMEKEFTLLARGVETLVELAINSPINTSFNEYVERYYVFLRQHVFDVTDIQTDEIDSEVKWRTVTFRDEFFYTKDIYTEYFRNVLFERMLSNKTPVFESKVLENQLISFFFSEPSIASLTLLLGACLIGFEDNKLKFFLERPASDVEQLRNINIAQSMINEAKLAVRTASVIYLRSLHLKTSIDFGNIDLPSQSLNNYPLRNIEMNSETLKNAIVKLCAQSTSQKVVTIDDSLDKSLLTARGGLASCVGNILTYDEETEMLKVQHLDQLTPAQENAKSLYLQLSREIDNLHKYRFHVRTERLPKCQIDFKNLARDFLSRLTIVAEESIDYEIEKIDLKKFKLAPNTNFHQTFVTQNLEVLHIHSEVLKWWKTSNTGEYDTKPCDLYQLATKNINLEPEISEMHALFYFKQLKYFKYMFSGNVTKYIEPLGAGFKLVVVTETVILTTIKILRSLKSLGFNNEYTVLDLEHLWSIESIMIAKSLFEELRTTTKVLIVVWTQMSHGVILREFSQLFKLKRFVIVANNEFRATLESHLEWLDAVYYIEVESLVSIQSHKEIMRDTKVIFQGQNVTLDEIMDDESVTYVKGDVLEKVVSNYILHIGKNLNNSQCNEVRVSLIDSGVGLVQKADVAFQMSSESKVNRRFHQIVDDVVLLIDATGMDKSALLTHLALNTREDSGILWIVRVNFPDHVKQFGRWQDDDTKVDDLESLKFLCQVTMNYKLASFNLALTKDKAQVVSCVGDAVAAFELNLFVRFYNERRVIFVFDAVDEVGPHCRDKVVKFLIVVSTRLRKSKMWITSRSHSDILPELERVLGKGFTRISCSDSKEDRNNIWNEVP